MNTAAVIQSTHIPHMKSLSTELHAAVVLPAAGCGSRFGTSTPKQVYLALLGSNLSGYKWSNLAPLNFGTP